jgi:SPP1 gp7 family putative phage head morphogenesis protein
MSAELALEDLFRGMVLESQEYEAVGVEEEELAQYQFVTALDELVCEECSAFNGDIYDEDEIDALFDWEELTPEVLRANLHINCRCELLRVSAPESENIYPDLL